MDKINSIVFLLVLIFSAIVVAVGIFIYRTDILDQIKSEEPQVVEEEMEIQPITDDDHILGNPNADVVIIEYSDFECPYCKEFHSTMRLAIKEFSRDQRLAWVYRHSPSRTEGSESMRVSLVSECIAKHYDESKFWKFTNAIFDNAPSSLQKNQTDQILKDLGLDPVKLNSCTSDSDIIAKVNEDIEDRDFLASTDSEFGTPYNVIVSEAETTAISGAMPYTMLKDILGMYSLGF